MSLGIVYLLGHPQLAARLVVSLHSLRKWYQGAVTVFTSHPASHQIGASLSSDHRLNVEHRMIREIVSDHAHRSSYLTKAMFLAESPFDTTVFLDADTVVSGPIDELLHKATCGPMTVTMYGPLTTSDPRTNAPIRAWQDVLGVKTDVRWREALAQVLTVGYPLVNAGVFAVQRDAEIIKDWQNLTMLGRSTPTPEETALQLALVYHSYQLLGCHFNYIPQFPPPMRDIRIWHFAGVSHLKSTVSRSIWLNEYRQCLMQNIARITEWSYVKRKSEFVKMS